MLLKAKAKSKGKLITIVGIVEVQKRNKEKKQRTNAQNKVRMIDSDNFTRVNREELNIALAIYGKMNKFIAPPFFSLEFLKHQYNFRQVYTTTQLQIKLHQILHPLKFLR